MLGVIALIIIIGQQFTFALFAGIYNLSFQCYSAGWKLYIFKIIIHNLIVMLKYIEVKPWYFSNNNIYIICLNSLQLVPQITIALHL